MFWRTLSIPLFACMFLAVPDVDLLLLSLLHHRSILTHSALPALVLLPLQGRFGPAPVAGALIGLSVHLTCDLLSPAVGFGQVWLPAPFKASLGGLSPAWLFANALLCFILAHGICRRLMPGLAGPTVMMLTSGGIGVAYGLGNEKSLLSAGVCLVLPGILGFRIRRQLRRTAA